MGLIMVHGCTRYKVAIFHIIQFQTGTSRTWGNLIASKMVRQWQLGKCDLKTPGLFRVL